MKKKVNLKEKRRKEGIIINQFLNFGNKKSVFISITLAVILLTIIGISLLPENKILIKYFSVIWVIEAIYIWIYFETKKRYNFKQI